MFIRRLSYSILLAATCAMPVLAMGGGGGGGSAPSESAPQYDAAVEYRKGIAALQAKDFKAAKTAFDHVISVAPKDANSQYMAGVSRVGLNDWKGAKRYFEKAMKLDPSLLRAERDLAVAYAKTGDKPKAEAALAALQAKASSCGAACPQASDLKAAIEAIGTAMAGGPQAAKDKGSNLIFATPAQGDDRYLSAVSLINEGKFETAITTLKAAQASFGPHPDILTYQGFANRKLKRFAVAEEYYRQALAAAPGHRGATEYYGELMVERGDMTAAKAMLASLDAQCRFGCAEAEELRRWITAGRSPHS